MLNIQSPKIRRVIRQCLIIVGALLMAVATFQIPFMSAEPVVIETSNYQHEDAGETNEEIKALVEKGSLSDEELVLLTQKLEEIAELNSQSTDDSNGPDASEKHTQARRGGVLWLIPLWALFYWVLPRTKIEFIEVVALPVFFYGVGVMLLLEIAIILALGIFFYIAKKWYRHRSL